MSERAEVKVDTPGAASEWRRLGTASVLGIGLWVTYAAIFFVEGALFMLPFVIAYAVAFFLLRREGTAGLVTLLVTSGTLLLVGLLFGFEDLAHPESWRGFISILLVVLVAGTGVLAGIGGLRGWDVSWTSRIGMSAAAILATGVVLGLGAGAALQADVAETGDIEVRVQDVAFLPARLSASPGTVSFFVQNEDPVRHTFTIRALGIEVELPAGTDRRVSLEAPPGTYDVICAVPGHESMIITLTVGD